MANGADCRHPVFMRDRVTNRVRAFAGEPGWRPAARGHLALMVLALLAAANVLAVVRIG